MQTEKNPNIEVTWRMSHTVKQRLISKVLFLVILSVLLGYIRGQQSKNQLARAEGISLEYCAESPCLEEVADFKELLSADGMTANPAVSIPLMMLSMAVLFGFYELMSWLLGLLIKKII